VPAEPQRPPGGGPLPEFDWATAQVFHRFRRPRCSLPVVDSTSEALLTVPLGDVSALSFDVVTDVIVTTAAAGDLSAFTWALRVLVVDDDCDSALIMDHILGARGGMDVTYVLDPEEALTLSEGQPWDVVVTDVVMPGMSGIELMARLRKRWPTLPVITVTSQMGISAATYIISSQADDSLIKPIDSVALLEIVTRLGKGGRAS
jgi:CheY-like chemotaxis protein